MNTPRYLDPHRWTQWAAFLAIAVEGEAGPKWMKATQDVVERAFRSCDYRLSGCHERPKPPRLDVRVTWCEPITSYDGRGRPVPMDEPVRVVRELRMRRRGPVTLRVTLQLRRSWLREVWGRGLAVLDGLPRRADVRFPPRVFALQADQADGVTICTVARRIASNWFVPAMVVIGGKRRDTRSSRVSAAA